MTTFGKILTVFVLLFSVGLGALNALIYMKSVQWADYGKKQALRADVTEASEKSLKAENKKLVEERDALNVELNRIAGVNPADDVKTKVNKIDTQITTKDAQVKSQMAQIGGLEKDLTTEKKKTAEFNAIVSGGQLEAAQSLRDKNTMKDLLNKAEKANVELLAAANAARDKQVNAEIALIAVKEVNKQLEERTQDLVKENVRLAKQLQTGNTGASGVTTVSLSAPNPPNFAVDAKVLGVTGDGLVEISVGSDAGLRKGHTLEVFRVTPRGQYLCMIRLITVDANKSVGQIIGKQVAVQRGDNVASKIVN